MKKRFFSSLLAVFLCSLISVQFLEVAFAESIDEDDVASDNDIVSVETVDTMPVEYNSGYKEGNFVRYIDRLDVPEYCIDLYNTLSDVNFWLNDNNFSRSGPYYDMNRNMIMIKVADVAKSKAEEELTSEIRMTIFAVQDDHPEFFWLKGSAHCFAVSSENRYELYAILCDFDEEDQYDIRMDKYKDISLLREDVERFNNKVDAILSTAKGTNYQKILAFNSYLTKNNSYNSIVHNGGETPIESANSFDAIMGNTGAKGPVCSGYAKAFKVLCDRASIPCVLVTGVAGGRHMWNYVKLSGKWYGVDVTWNDPSGMNIANSGKEHTKYLAIGADTYVNGTRFGSRILDAEVKYGPVINNTPYNPNTVERRYTVSFDMMGYCDDPESQTIVDGNYVIQPQTPDIKDYIFIGWYNGTEKWDFFSDGVTTDLTLTAKFEKKQEYTVTFDALGIINSPDDQIVYSGDCLTEPIIPQVDGYRLYAWYNGDRIWDFANDKVTDNITLTAKWFENVYCTVVFGGGMSLIPHDTQTVLMGERLTKPEDPIDDGYVFDCWLSDERKEWDFENDVVLGDMYLYPCWLKSSGMLGDVNCDHNVSVKDVVCLYQYVSKIDVTIDAKMADVKRDNVLNIKDVVLLYQYVSKWPVTLG